jgi:hypothetical protein
MVISNKLTNLQARLQVVSAGMWHAGRQLTTLIYITLCYDKKKINACNVFTQARAVNSHSYFFRSHELYPYICHDSERILSVRNLQHKIAVKEVLTSACIRKGMRSLRGSRLGFTENFMIHLNFFRRIQGHYLRIDHDPFPKPDIQS